MAENPSLVLRFVKTKGFSLLIFLASLAITAKSAPTNGARSILLITKRSDLVMPGPPLRGILSPAATSITKIVMSTNSGLNVAAKLSPPLSTMIKSRSLNFFYIVAMADKLIETSSRMAV